MKENKGEQPELTPVQWMDRAIKCLYLELPAPIADDVAMRWKAAQEYLHTAQPSKVQEKEAIEALTGTLDVYKQVIKEQEQEIERLKGLMKEEFFKNLSHLLRTDKAMNNLWYEFSIKNNL